MIRKYLVVLLTSPAWLSPAVSSALTVYVTNTGSNEPVGSPVRFPNRDNTQHHVYSFSRAKTFNIDLYAGKPETNDAMDLLLQRFREL